MSIRLTLLGVSLRSIARPYLARLSDPMRARQGIALMARLFLSGPRGVTVERVEADCRVPPFLRVTPPEAGLGVMIYFHGGGYIAGSPDTHIGLLAALARAAGTTMIAPRYRLAPEHPFPAAQEDAFAVWTHLVRTGVPPDQIVLAGDSAGGGLALSLLSQLCTQKNPPAAVLAFSPWTDLTGSGPSCRENARRDPLLPVGRLHELAEYALDGRDPRDPQASPLFADYPECPPVFFAASNSEILRDDSLRLARRLDTEGARIEVEVHDSCLHAWPIFAGRLPEADETIQRAAEFLRKVTGREALQRTV